MATHNADLVPVHPQPAPVAVSARAARRCGRGRAGLVVGLAAASVLAFLPGAALAEPPASLAQVQARVDDLNSTVGLAVEQYQQAQVRLEALRTDVAAAQAEVVRQQQAVDAMQAAVADVVASAYRSGGGASKLEMLTSSGSVQGYLDRVTSLDQLSAEQGRRLAAVQQARAQLAEAERKAQDDLIAQQAVQAAAADRKAAVERDLAAQQGLLAGLQQQQRDQLAAAQASRSAQQDAAGRGSAAALAVPAVSGPASGAAATAVAAASSRLGMPYVWAAAGPTSFDCSGLTLWAYAKAGISLPHSAEAQYAMSRKVPQSEIQPGDLVFFGRPITHMGIYVGGGNMIAAPHTGDVVKVSSAFYGNYIGAARPY